MNPGMMGHSEFGPWPEMILRIYEHGSKNISFFHSFQEGCRQQTCFGSSPAKARDPMCPSEGAGGLSR